VGAVSSSSFGDPVVLRRCWQLAPTIHPASSGSQGWDSGFFEIYTILGCFNVILAIYLVDVANAISDCPLTTLDVTRLTERFQADGEDFD
jgi:hypothetical protein